MARYINADKLLTVQMKSKYYHLSNGDTAIPIIDIEHALTEDVAPVVHSGWEHFKVNGQYKIRCKNCDYIEPEYKSYVRDFCPCCGAKMDKEQ